MSEHGSTGKTQIVYFSHGGGPLPILGDAGHQSMVRFMSGLSVDLDRPDAIIVISAHWEERAATVLGAERPAMFYDYYGFPEEAYKIQYPGPGSPALAKQIVDCLEDAGLPARVDLERGFDHGHFIPLKLMYPEADIPSIQLSLLRGLNPAAHIALGKALRALNDMNLLVIGSGFSFHNMSAFFGGGGGGPDRANDAFQDWLINAVTQAMPESEREQLLIAWDTAPSARYCHPREEHLLPLHVCAALAGSPGNVIFDDQILGKRSVAFRW